MKFNLGYIFSKGSPAINHLGLNEWIINEGRADKMEVHHVSDAEAEYLGLNQQENDQWFRKEKIGDNDILDIEKTLDTWIESGMIKDVSPDAHLNIKRGLAILQGDLVSMGVDPFEQE